MLNLPYTFLNKSMAVLHSMDFNRNGIVGVSLRTMLFVPDKDIPRKSKTTNNHGDPFRWIRQYDLLSYIGLLIQDFQLGGQHIPLCSVLFLITAPLFWYGTSIKKVPAVKRAPTEHSHGNRSRDKFSITLRVVIANPIFWGLLITFAAFALNQGMVISQIFPLLESRQVSTDLAIFLASCIGPMQVIARLLLFCVESLSRKNIPIVRVALFCQICLAVSSISLAFGGISISVIISFVLLQGGPYGLVSIIRPLITAELLGRTNFGVISSIVGMGFVWGFALAPGIAGKVAERWSYDEVLLATFSASVVGILSLLLTLQLRRTSIQP